MFRRIVIPLDGSEVAERAVPYGVELARLLGIPLHLVRVVDDSERLGGAAADLAEMAAEYLDHVRAWLVERGLAVTMEVRRGAPRTEIVLAIQAHDLLILAPQGEGASSDLPLAIAADAFGRPGRRSILLVPPSEV